MIKHVLVMKFFVFLNCTNHMRYILYEKISFFNEEVSLNFYS